MRLIASAAASAVGASDGRNSDANRASHNASFTLSRDMASLPAFLSPDHHPPSVDLASGSPPLLRSSTPQARDGKGDVGLVTLARAMGGAGSLCRGREPVPFHQYRAGPWPPRYELCRCDRPGWTTWPSASLIPADDAGAPDERFTTGPAARWRSGVSAPGWIRPSPLGLTWANVLVELVRSRRWPVPLLPGVGQGPLS